MITAKTKQGLNPAVAKYNINNAKSQPSAVASATASASATALATTRVKSTTDASSRIDAYSFDDQSSNLQNASSPFNNTKPYRNGINNDSKLLRNSNFLNGGVKHAHTENALNSASKKKTHNSDVNNNNVNSSVKKTIKKLKLDNSNAVTTARSPSHASITETLVIMRPPIFTHFWGVFLQYSRTNA